MSDDNKQKKLRLYKFAAEYNLSTDSLLEFLQAKNYNVKSHSSILTDEMIDDIRVHFKRTLKNQNIITERFQNSKKVLETLKKKRKLFRLRRLKLVKRKMFLRKLKL